MLSKLGERFRQGMNCKRELEEVKEWLWKYRKLVKQTEALRERLAATREQLTSARALVYDDMPHGTGNLSDLSDVVARLEEQEGEVLERILGADNARAEIVDALNTLPPITRQVMYERYISWKSWERIATRHKLSASTVHRIHKDGLERLRMRK